MSQSAFTVRKCSGALGAEILDIDLSRSLGEETVSALRQVWFDHLVVFFRDQDLSPPQFLAFAKHFGDIVEYPMVKGLEECPEIVPVIKLEHEVHNFGGIWHSDTTYLQTPPMAAMLAAQELPPFGGDTLFGNMYDAYEILSDGMKSLLAPLVAVNSSAKSEVTRSREDRLKTDAKQEPDAVLQSEHPVVRTHPETGRKSLYVNRGHTIGFRGMTEEESAPLLNYLFDHIERPEFSCRFRWAPGSIAFWDNRASQHNPINDYHGYRRVMHRITLAGDTPR